MAFSIRARRRLFHRWQLLACLTLLGASSLVAGCKRDREAGEEASVGQEDSSGGEVPRREPDGSELPAVPTHPPAHTALVTPGDEPSAEPETPPEEPDPIGFTDPDGDLPSEPEIDHAARWGERDDSSCRAPARPPLSAAARPHVERGVAAASNGDADGARAAFMSAVSADPRSYQALFNLGVLSDRGGNEAQALDYYRQALRIQADFVPALRGVVAIHIRRGQAAQALSEVESLARRFRANLALQALHADVLVHNHRYQQAWDAARVALRCDERFVPALRSLVRASLAQERRELAEQILNQAIAADPRDPELFVLKAELLSEEVGRAREVLEAYRRAVALRPTYTEARVALGALLLRGGNYQEALQQYQAAAEVNPTLAAVHLGIGDAHRSLRQWAEAKAAYDRVLQLDANLPAVYFNLGLLYRTAQAEFPGLDLIQTLTRAKDAFTRYRNLMGPRLSRDDPSEAYLAEVERLLGRARRAAEEAEREAAREAAGGTEGGDAPADDGSGDDDGGWM